MPTNAQADAIYQKALAELHSVVADPEATPEEKQIAKEKRDTLIMDFIGKAIASVEERTAKFQTFIDEMNALIAEFDPATTLAGILRLKTVVDEAAGLVGAATGVGAAPAKRAMRGVRGAKAPKKASRRPAPVPSGRGAARKRLKTAKGARHAPSAAGRKPARKASRPARKGARKKGASR